MDTKGLLKEYLEQNIQQQNECWVWTAERDGQGYGLVERKWSSLYNTPRAHRLAYFVYAGELKKGLVICHKCDNPSCINPDHLWQGTVGDNNRDCRDKGRHVPGPGCPKGAKRPRKNPGAPPKKAINNKLVETQVLDIRARYANGEKVNILATEYNVTHNTIYFIVQRKTWRFI